MRSLSLILGACTLGGVLAQAQQAPSSHEPAFDTASIRAASPEPGCYSELPPGGTQYAVTCMTLRNLVALAWKLHPDDIEAADKRALDSYYDIRATTAAGQLWDRESVRPMLRQLLVERFHLAAHPGSREVAGYALVVAKGGPRLKASEVDAGQAGQQRGVPMDNYIVPGGVHLRGVKLAAIAGVLASPAHAPVVDRTGIPGNFDLDLHFATENSTESNLPDFFAAVQEQLGLKLQPEKLTIPTLVLDHVDNQPTAN